MDRRSALKTLGAVPMLGGISWMFTRPEDREKRKSVEGATMVLQEFQDPKVFDADGNDITGQVYKTEILPGGKVYAHTYALDEDGNFYYDEKMKGVALGEVHFVSKIEGEFVRAACWGNKK